MYVIYIVAQVVGQWLYPDLHKRNMRNVNKKKTNIPCPDVLFLKFPSRLFLQTLWLPLSKKLNKFPMIRDVTGKLGEKFQLDPDYKPAP